jgi:hypothetical protein
VETVNPATWSEDLLVRLHREVLLVPDIKGTLAVAAGRADAMIIAGLPMGYEDIAAIPLIIGEAGGASRTWTATTSCPGTAPSWPATGTFTTHCSTSSGTCRPAGITNLSCGPAGSCPACSPLVAVWHGGAASSRLEAGPAALTGRLHRTAGLVDDC